MKVSMRGFVLLVTLVFLQVFIMTGLFALLQVSLVFKKNFHLWLGEEGRRTAIMLLHDVERQVEMHLPECMVTVIAATDLSARQIGWWRQNSCEIATDAGEYHYVVEALGIDACALVKDDKNNSLAADYYRVTLLALPGDIKGARILLQGTVIKAAHTMLACNDSPHYVNLGRQMLREI